MEKDVPAPYTPAELWLVKNRVCAIRASYTMTGADTADYYIELESFNGNKVKWKDSTFNKVATLRLCGTDLVELKYGVLDRVKKRLAYEEANAAELATYERLKAKYEGATP